MAINRLLQSLSGDRFAECGENLDAVAEPTTLFEIRRFITDVHQISVDLNGGRPSEDGFERGDEDNPLKGLKVGPSEVL